jgi:protein-glutamine gamma-glutamyltransferase
MSARALRVSARVAAALGLLSISLTGEISPSWLALSWSAWLFSFLADRFAWFQARLRRLETLAVMGMVALLFVDFFILRDTIFIAVTHFLLFFQIVKLAGEKKRKDNLQMFLFSFFQLLAACTLSVDAWHAVVLLAFIPTATTALFWNQMEREREGAKTLEDAPLYRNYRRMSVLICTAALPLIVFLTTVVFVLFPRVTLNASLPGFVGHHAGYTDQMNLAQTGTLHEDAAVVLWLSFPKAGDRQGWDGYLRGDVLTAFDGRQWHVSSSGRARSLAPDSNGVFFIRPHTPDQPLSRASVTLADTSANTLFVTGKPVRVMAALPALQENGEGTLRWASAWNRPLRYEVIAEPLSDSEVRPAYLQLPDMPLERTRALGRKIAGNGAPLEQAQKIERYLREHYRYSTDFGNRIAPYPVEDFLFERRQGACGHFASAMALMLRLRKIPSRVVAGYYKGEWNEPAQCVVVRGRDAHAWVEAYIPGKGWIAFDPTPAPAAGAVSHTNILHRLQQYWDYLSYQWNRFVIQYDLYSQIKAFETVKGTWWPHLQLRFHHRRAPSNTESEKGASATTHFPWKKSAVFILLSGSAWLLFTRHRASSLEAPIRFYHRFLQQMAREGHPKAPHETGWEYAARLQRVPNLKASVMDITQRYYLLRFRAQNSRSNPPIFF